LDHSKDLADLLYHTALAIIAFTAVAMLRVSSSEALLDLVLWSNGSAGWFAFLRYWFHFSGIAFEPVTCHFGCFHGALNSVGIMVIGISFFSQLFL
jgi:hypothetical protein